jgi:hypothetical protein
MGKYGKLEDMISSYLGDEDLKNNYVIKPKINIPDFTNRLRYFEKKAEETDDFESLFNSWKNIAQDASRWGKTEEAISALRNAHKRYVATQKTLFSVALGNGDLMDAVDHLKNAHVSVSIQAGYRTIELPLLFEEEERESYAQSLDEAVRSTRPGYFIKKLSDAAAAGDLEGFDFYRHLFIKNQILSDNISKRELRKDFEPRTRYDVTRIRRFWMIQRKVREFHMKTYEQAILNEFKLAVGEALQTRREYSSNEDKIKRRMQKIQDLMLEFGYKFEVPIFCGLDIPGSPYTRIIKMIDRVVGNGTLDLIDLHNDPKHPLREILEPANGGYLGMGVIGFRYRKDNQTTKEPLASENQLRFVA